MFVYAIFREFVSSKILGVLTLQLFNSIIIAEAL